MADKNPTEECWRITDLDGKTLAYGYWLGTLSVTLRVKQEQGLGVKDIMILFGEKAQSHS